VIAYLINEPDEETKEEPKPEIVGFIGLDDNPF
jgi:hypothetical protein